MNRSVAILLGALVACSTSESLPPGAGLDLQLQIPGAQLQRGDLGPDDGGPEVTQVLLPQSTVRRGEATVAASGRLGEDGVALHLQADGDPDHWVVGARGFDFVVQDELLWSVQLAFSHTLPDDRLTVRLQAADGRGRSGPIRDADFVITDDLPPATWLVSLGWDTEADVDLAVETPEGAVISAKDRNSLPPPPAGQVPPPDAWMEGGWLDFDSNRQCAGDLLRRENVVWTTPTPPRGTYRVYAQLFSPCGAPVTEVEVLIQRDGEPVDRARASLYPFDARVQPDDDDAPGLFLLEFEVE